MKNTYVSSGKKLKSKYKRESIIMNRTQSYIEFVSSKQIQILLQKIQYHMGFLSGMSSLDDNISLTNEYLIRQEVFAYFKSKDKNISFVELYGGQEDSVRTILDIYNIIEKKTSMTSMDILKNNEKYQKQSDNPFEISQQIVKEFEALEENEIVLKSAFASYRFMEDMPYEQQNDIWFSIYLNLYLQEKKLISGYYIPFLLYFKKMENKKKNEIQYVQESGNYESWLLFYLRGLEQTFSDTRKVISSIKLFHNQSLEAVEGNKQEKILTKIIVYIEQNPIFAIQDISKKFDVAFNTASKLVSILEGYGVVSEISKKQRYRMYCYSKYL